MAHYFQIEEEKIGSIKEHLQVEQDVERPPMCVFNVEKIIKRISESHITLNSCPHV